MSKSKLEQLFIDAAAAGYKRPQLHSLNFKYYQAPSTGRNPNAVYIKNRNGVYQGKIVDGVIKMVYLTAESVFKEITSVMTDPHGAAIQFGRRTGQCAICGRPLDNKVSVALGIGPICNERFGWMLPADEDLL